MDRGIVCRDCGVGVAGFGVGCCASFPVLARAGCVLHNNPDDAHVVGLPLRNFSLKELAVPEGVSCHFSLRHFLLILHV